MPTLNDTRRTVQERLASGEPYDPLYDAEEYAFVHPGSLPGLPAEDPGSMFYTPCHRPGEIRLSGDGRTWLREALYVALADRTGRYLHAPSPERQLIVEAHDALCRASLHAHQWPAVVGMALTLAEEQSSPGLAYLAEWIEAAVAAAMGVPVAVLRDQALAEATALRQAAQ